MNDGELREKALHLSSFIVEAPAGSGKTSLLTDRFLKLLTVVDMPEEIVAITFTKKAASEMKAKIIERIKESKSPFAQTILKRSEEKGWDIEHNLSRLKVMTIDKFCHNVVSQIPVLSKMGSKPNITDTPEKFYEESVKQTLQAKDGIEDIKVVFTHYDNEYEKINRRLVAMMSIRDQWKYRCYMLTQKSSGQIIEEGNAYLEHLTKPIYQKIRAELNQDQLNDLIEILHYLESTNLREDIKLKIKTVLILIQKKSHYGKRSQKFYSQIKIPDAKTLQPEKDLRTMTKEKFIKINVAISQISIFYWLLKLYRNLLAKHML